MAVVYLTFILPLTDRPPFCPFFLAFQRCGDRFWGAASSTHILVRGIEFRLISHIYVYTARQIGLVVWHCLDWPWKAGNYLSTGIGIVFLILGRRILRRETRGFRVRHEPCLSLPSCRKELSCYFLSLRNQHKWVTTRTCSIGKSTKGYRCRTRVTLHCGGTLTCSSPLEVWDERRRFWGATSLTTSCGGWWSRCSRDLSKYICT